MGTPRDTTRGLFELYQDEKKAEVRTRQKIKELQDNSDHVLQCKLRLVEKLLDVKVKDEMALMRRSANIAVVETDTALVNRKAQDRLLREVDAVIPTARDKYPDTFATHFEALASVHDSDLRESIKKSVEEHLDGELQALRARRNVALSEQPNKIDAVERETEGVILKGQRDLLASKPETATQEHLDRIQRVKDAERKMQRRPEAIDPASLSELMRCTPTPHGYRIGLLEAEINDLRKLIYSQRAEEEKLLLERSAKIAVLESEESDMQAEVHRLATELSSIQEELETKQHEIVTMRDSAAPKTGKWAVDIQALEDSLDALTEEELKLKRDYDSVSKAVGTVDADKRLLNDKFHDEVEDLSALQDQYRQIVDKIEEQLFQAKEDILALRHEDLENTRRVNDLRWRANHGGEERANVTRAFKERLNQTMGQLHIEERLQKILQAKIILLEQDADQLRTAWNAKIAEQRLETQNLRRAIEQQVQLLKEGIEEMTNLKTGMQAGISQARNLYSPQQYDDMIVEKNTQWSTIVYDTARQVANTKAQILVNEEENEMILDAMGHIVVTGRLLDKEGIDIETSPTPQLAATANRMYDDLAAAAHRETKLRQLFSIFKDIEERRGRNEPIPQLTGKRHLSRAERRSRRMIRENTWLAKEIAKQNVSLQSAFPVTDDQKAALDHDRSPAQSGADHPTVDHAHKLRVVNFIKSEIQPLYDTEQITKRRFIAIVARVSSAFLESHPVAPALTQENKAWLSRKIQEVISLQDEAMSRRRADQSSVARHGR
eukprot:TRINITY_DN66389_c0_g1_i1.p1 TRINITY_DN66389_c0_g1~~TRINITY_DN66389_c0_g1_i1.p1  ORF type:complete len:779 (+),score=384.52 TRINITY_DN66389_c0_g1_i1:63-2399(+)